MPDHARDGPSRGRSTSRDRPARRNRSRSRSRKRDDHRARDRDHRRRSASPRTQRRSRSRSPGQRRSRSRERHHHKRRHSRSSSSSSSSSESDSVRRRRKKKQEKRERKERKQEKREKRDKKRKKKNGTASSSRWGKYGVIGESDFYNKTHEFRTWLLEERKINPETVSKDQERKEFAVFVEDYNTATLPHEKYYNMDAHEHRMAALRAGDTLPPPDDGYDPAADLRAHGAAHKRTAVERESYLSKEQLQELRKVQHERVQASKMRQLGMEVGQTMGVRMDGSKFDEV